MLIRSALPASSKPMVSVVAFAKRIDVLEFGGCGDAVRLSKSV